MIGLILETVWMFNKLEVKVYVFSHFLIWLVSTVSTTEGLINIYV